MKILLVLNKFLVRNGNKRIDSGHFNVYVPLLELGHDVKWYDTVEPEEKDFKRVVDEFSPDIIFCCFTGNSNFAPYEPLKEIEEITKMGNIKTFNWFCDDTWRFENFSSKICKAFHCCSTPEPSYLEKFKAIGYNNIILGSWHCNRDLHVKPEALVKEVGFCGGVTRSRQVHLANLSNLFDVGYFGGCTYEEMFLGYSACKVGVNFSVNDNDPSGKTQMKLRVMEIANAGSLLITEYTSGLEDLFVIGEEIVAFSSPEEMIDKVRFYLDNEESRLKIAKRGEDRFVKDHESKIRMEQIINQINKI